MSINLLQSMQNTLSQLTKNDGTVQASGAAVAERTQAIIKSEILNLLPGQTLQGELVNQDGKNAQLLLNNSLLLNTQLDSTARLATGSPMTFQVKSNKQGQLTLRPLFANMANSQTAQSALTAAGIGISDSSMKMVSTMMEKGMPVNRDMLNQVNKELAQFPKADVEDIVMLHKMNLPVNESNLKEIHLYMNNNHYMMDSVEQTADSLSKMLLSMAEEGNVKEMAKGLEQIFGSLGSGENANADNQTMNTGNITAAKAMNIINENNEIDGSVKIKTPENNGNLTEGTQKNENGNTIANQLNSGEKVIISDKSKDTENIINNKNEQTLDDLNNTAKEAANDEKAAAQGKRPVITKDNVFEVLQQLPKAAVKSAKVKADIGNALQELLKEKMLLKPENVNKDNIKNYYNDLKDLTGNLEKLLAQQGKTDTAFGRELSQVKSNVDFMNQVNELYNYVQLPLKMSSNQANGDLYVYTKKKKHSGPADDTLTALLHLSMDNLGDMDIFLSLKSEKLSTNFCLEKEENIALIEAHIDELNARLIKKGYNVETKVTKSEDMGKEKKSVIDNIVNEDKVMLLNTQSFDAMA